MMAAAGTYPMAWRTAFMKHVLPRFLRPVWPCVSRRLVVRPRLEILLRRCKSCGKRQQQKEGRKGE